LKAAQKEDVRVELKVEKLGNPLADQMVGWKVDQKVD